MSSNRIALSRALAAVITLLSAQSLAQPKADGFALNRFEPSERGSEWFTNESLDLRGNMRLAAGLVLDYANKPLALYEPDGDYRVAIVEHQLFGHVGGALVLADRFRVGLSLPVAIYQSGQGGDTPDQTFESGNDTTLGDLRLTGDVRIVGEYDTPFTLAAGLQFFAPTGSQESYTGDGSVRLGPRVLGAGNVGMFTYAARLGFTWRDNDEDYGGEPMGSEINYGAAAGVRVLDDKLVAGPEIFGSTVVTDSDALFGRQQTPFEVVFGAHYLAAKQIRVGAGIGPGLTRAYGTPKWRALASVEFVAPYEKQAPPPPPPAPADTDNDGIINAEDACPDVPGVRTSDPMTNGCPPPSDRDGDTIIDPEDACPDEKGVKTDDPKTNGCPEPKDTDGDGILDNVDACPEAPGPRSEDPKKNGCPIARVEKGEIKILEQVQFAYNSDRILKTSDYILEAVKKVLDDNTQIKKVEVQGHTDSKGGDQFNMGLSKRRAESVVKWLTKKGIDKKRLVSKGYGETQPIDSNDTEEGRANNRRVVFQISEKAE